MQIKRSDLYLTVEKMMSAGKGILAADESNHSVPKRLDPIHVESTAENRRRFRSLFLSAPGAEEYMSGVILYDETLRQKDDLGIPFPKTLSARGIVPGIKVDGGTKPIPEFPDEVMTEGLDRLGDRLMEYHDLGARFAKWRSVIQIGKGIPTQECIDLNMYSLAVYALRCQEAGIVPMVEPEVLIHGTHSIEKAEEVITLVLQTLMHFLDRYRVDKKGTIVKTSMALPGDESGHAQDPEHVAEATSRALRNGISPDIGGVVFLSGGQTSDQATINLNAIAKRGPYSWPVTFCYARALQYPAIDIWQGKEENIEKAREAFLGRLQANAAASTGNYQ